ncbi:hypothetical protein BpHYR1_038043 [Brachionus plicatilis]|uniref:Uncharacterized protein n=1 Tax=Brachionus plicatilis TaxID=10195 RepID=A0A3M7PSJ0_BRAPC|nr:hypothetical protein BpHYR1_038043 [Brachionus plicatilis]
MINFELGFLKKLNLFKSWHLSLLVEKLLEIEILPSRNYPVILSADSIFCFKLVTYDFVIMRITKNLSLQKLL